MDLVQDLRFALRTFRRAPVFTAVAVASLAFGIGANTAVFTLTDQILLRLMPVKNPQELVQLAGRGNHYGSNRGGNALSYPMYKDFRGREDVFSGVLCRFDLPMSLTFDGRTERVSGELVSGNYFEVLGVQPAAGRVFNQQDDLTPGGHPVAVLGYGFWKSRFAADPGVVGKTMVINGHNLEVVGVSQEGFDGVEQGVATQVFVPVLMKGEMTPLWNDLENRRSRWVNVIGRLRAGMTVEKAQAALQPFFHSMLEQEVREAAFANAPPYSREQFLKMAVEVLPGSQGRTDLSRNAKKPLLVLTGIAAFVLLIACANVAGLLVARAASRQKEIAVRLALGAGRMRVIRQLVAESLLLAALGGAAGVALAFFASRFLLTFLTPPDQHLTISATPDWRVLTFTILVSVGAGLVFGLLPALQATRPKLAPVLKDQAGAVTGGGAAVRLRKLLVVTQVTLSLLLLIGAGLFIRTLRELRNIHPGFTTENLIAFAVDPSLNGYSVDRTKLFYRQLLEGLQQTSGVHSAALASVPILYGWEWDSTITVEGYETKPGEDMNPFFNSISPGYFETLGIPVLTGRDFRDSDVDTLVHRVDRDTGKEDKVPKAVVVNHKLAEHYFEARGALGRHIGFGGDPGTKADMEIIGVIGDAKYMNVRDEVPWQVFIPFLASDFVSGMTGYVRTDMPPEQVFSMVRERVRKLDPNLPVYNLRSFETQVDRSLSAERAVASLSTMFGLVATLLALIGLYGVMAYTVARRTREIGIRMALGALQGNVLWLVMREVLILVGAGIAIGLPAAVGLSRLVESQLFGIQPHDPLTLAAATVVLALVSAAAGYLPARRATRVNPVQALRYE
jgi:putative ABC transport system permease protein